MRGGAWLSALTLGLLVACGNTTVTLPGPAGPVTAGPVVTAPAAPAGATQPAAALSSDGEAIHVPTASYANALVLGNVTATDDPNALQELYQARMLTFKPAEGYAMLATQAATLPSDPAHTQVLEKNAGVITGGGMTAAASAYKRLWATGGLGVWGTAYKRMWATGQYSPVPENTTLWQQVGLEEAQQYAPRLGEGVKVAVIDTGIDPNHIAFEGALAPRDEWRDFYDDDNDPTDVGVFGEGGYGHGTNTAGIVLQIAPRAVILPIRALGPDGGADVLTVARAIDYAVRKKARVINLSLGSSERSDAIAKAVARAAAAGVVVTEAAGNEGEERLNYPAADANTLGPVGSLSVSVGSVSALDVKSTFSNFSKSLELVAPGELVFGPAPGQTGGNWNMAAWSGTSMSAPMAAGALALALAENDRMVTGRFRGPSVMAAALTASANRSLYDLTGNSLFKNKLGLGRMNLGLYLRWVTYGL